MSLADFIVLAWQTTGHKNKCKYYRLAEIVLTPVS